MTELLNMIHSMKKLYDHLCLDVMEKYHITRSELDILLFLNNNPEFDSAKDIVEKRGLVKSHASMGIEKLLKNGYIESIQDKNDKRKYHLYLLPLSQPLIHDGLQVQKHFNEILFKNFTLEEKKIYQKMVQQMYDNIKQEEVHL
ncbi:MarR family transcriptional regulator [Candidatus Stoquefichus sp. SB1]|jgi:DNA-binding MarR family transcriptional regulator|uniref:MarR family transcriptional regulator n=1 Tax=Candidatus Stoquefichus sp. SB1 TaxID=1658109 RepID=UPI00067E7BBA|nr:MarR family transcriptional regulator [Candidatus Stoquefichus sp. SB1]